MSLQDDDDQCFCFSNKFTNKGVRKLLAAIVLFATGIIFNCYQLLGIWSGVLIAILPIIFFGLLFGQFFKEKIWSDSSNHAPLLTLGIIYTFMCWYILSQPQMT